MKLKNLSIAIGATAIAVALGVSAISPASAQGGNQTPTRSRLSLLGLQQCSATDYDQVVATALGIKPEELRVGLVSGQTLEAQAKSKNVDIATIEKALTDARSKDLDQAVTDGLLTKDQADMLKAIEQRRLSRLGQPGAAGTAPANVPTAPATSPATPNATPAAPNGNNPGNARHGLLFGQGIVQLFGARIGILGFGQIYTYNYEAVKPVAVLAQALNVKCADLAKDLESGKTVQSILTDKNIQAKTVTDSLIKAYQDALDQDVKEGLLTTAEAKGQLARLTITVNNMVNQSTRRPGGFLSLLFGQRGPFGFFNPFGFLGGRFPQLPFLPGLRMPGAAGTQQAQPTQAATATPSGQSS